MEIYGKPFVYLCFIIFVAGVTLLGFPPKAQSKVLQAGYGKYPPIAFQSDEGTVTGYGIEIVDAVMDRMGWTLDYARYPWKRLYTEIHQGQLDVGVGLLPTSSRKRHAHYSAPVLIDYDLVIVPADSDVHVDAIEDLQGLSLGAIQGFAYPTLENKPNIDLSRTRSLASNLNKLALGRVDAVVASALTALPELARRDIGYRIAGAVDRVPLSVVLADETFDRADLRRLNSAIAEVRSGSLVKAAAKRHGVAIAMQDFRMIE